MNTIKLDDVKRARHSGITLPTLLQLDGAELARLMAECELAQLENDNLRSELAMWKARARALEGLRDQAVRERDELRAGK